MHDIVLAEEHWNPTVPELRALSIEMIKLSQQDLPIERLDVSSELALEMFHDNPFKREQIPSVAAQNNGQVTVYRVGEHVDISKGPMMGSTGLLGRCTISASHPIKEGSERGKHFYRMQGVALPAVLRIGHFAYNILENRSRKLVSVFWKKVKRVVGLELKGFIKIFLFFPSMCLELGQVTK